MHHALLTQQVPRVLETVAEVDAPDFDTMGTVRRCRLLLQWTTKLYDDPIAEDDIDKHAKVFLKKAWRARDQMGRKVKTVLGTKYSRKEIITGTIVSLRG